jgi:glutathione S-transferase
MLWYVLCAVDLYGRVLRVALAVLPAYFIVFKDKTVARNVLAKPLGRIQSFVTRLMFPILKGMLMHAMQINRPGAEESWSKVERLVKEAEERLGDAPIGSRFLTGDTFSAADISFCSHVGLILIPPEHSFLAPHFSVDAIPDSVFRERCQWLRESKAGQFVLWCYRNKRPPMQQTANL